jgi:hypothetical protein
MAQASLAAGLMGRLHSHDLRRGAARDTANLQSKLKGIANKTATTVLGHNLSASNRPLTAHYVVAHDDDIWTKRIDEKYMDSIFTTPEAENSYQRRFQKLKAKEVTDRCISEGLDSNMHKDRARASKLLEKGRQADWADQENRKWQMLNTHSPEASLAPVTLGIGAPQVLKVTPTNVTTTAIKASEDCPTISTVTTNDIPMDPQLSEHARHLCNVMVGAADGSTDTQIEGLLLDSVQGTNMPTDQSDLHDTLGFVRRFSTINISHNQILSAWGNAVRDTTKQATLSRLEGNSRDNVTSFIYACKNHVYGCTFGHGFRVEVNRREEVCHITSRAIFENLARKEAAKAFACTEEGCLKRFDTVGKRNRHVKDLHGWPKPCPKECKGSFGTRSQFNAHMDTHGPFTPTRCLVLGCTCEKVFARPNRYRAHIQKVHKLFGNGIDPYMPYKKRAKFVPTPCQVEGCTSKAVFGAPNRYKHHLSNNHKTDEEEMELYLDGAGC